MNVTETPTLRDFQVRTQTQVRIKNILFATDFSKASDAALTYAAGIAGRYGAKLYTAHVCALEPQIPVAGVYADAATPKWSPSKEEMEEYAKAKIQNLLGRFHGIDCAPVVRSGEVWPVLSELIGQHNVDLLVIGTHGHTGIGKLFLGSEAEVIFRSAPRPVLTVGPHCSDCLNRTGEFRRILFATNFNTESRAAAELAISLAEENQAHLILLHVVEPPHSNELVRSEPLIPLSLVALEELFTASHAHCEHESLVKVGKAAEKILQVAREKEADLIIIGAHPYHRMGLAGHLPKTTAYQIVSRAVCPVLTVRE